jgi:hypothetical protein
MNAEPVILATFHTELQMTRIKALLENEGIVCYVKDEYVTQMRQFSYAGNSGIKLMVSIKDFEKASHILSESGYISPEDYTESKTEKLLREATEKFPLLGKILNFRISYAVSLLILVLLLLVVKQLFASH